MKIALIGCRGIPARYGGFETLAEQLALRLAAKGHAMTVYCRSRYRGVEPWPANGIRCITLPALYTKHLETLSHTLLCCLHQLFCPSDVILLMNNANAIFIPLLKLRKKKVFIHVDGLEWQRGKWGALAKAWHRWSERLAVRWSDGLISDSHVIADYYQRQYGGRPQVIAYGADASPGPGATACSPIADSNVLAGYGLKSKEYFLFVGRMEPENNPDLIIEAYMGLQAAICRYPLVMVGWAPYAKSYGQRLRTLADARVRFLGGIYGPEYRVLLRHCLIFLHASSVGGTHPVLVEAMEAGRPIIASDIPENRETLGDAALIASLRAKDVAANIQWALAHRAQADALGAQSARRAREHYRWDQVADAYERAFAGNSAL